LKPKETNSEFNELTLEGKGNDERISNPVWKEGTATDLQF